MTDTVNAADLPIDSIVADSTHVWRKQAWEAPGGGNTWSRTGTAQWFRDEAVDDAIALRGGTVLRVGGSQR